jgi:chromosome segregation ATPase
MTAEDRTRFEVLLESVQHDVRVIAEGHGALVERLDRVETRLDQLEARVDRNAIQIAVIDARVNSLEKRIAALEKRVDTLDTRVDSLRADTQHQLARVEAHLEIDEPPRPGTRPQRGAPKRRKPS